MHFIHIKYAVKNDEICGVNSDFPIIRITIRLAEQSDLDSQNVNIYLNLCQFFNGCVSLNIIHWMSPCRNRLALAISLALLGLFPVGQSVFHRCQTEFKLNSSVSAGITLFSYCCIIKLSKMLNKPRFCVGIYMCCVYVINIRFRCPWFAQPCAL